MGDVEREPDQLSLFDTGVDVMKLREQQRNLMARDASANTKLAYSYAWKQFSEWCVAAGRRPLPASEESVCLFLTHLLEERKLAVTTAALAKAAIVAAHKANDARLVINGGVTALLNGARRSRAGAEVRDVKEALTVGQMLAMVSVMVGRRPIVLRDRAVLAVGFASGMRRSELVGLDLSDVEFKTEGVLLRIRRSKTDQVGVGREVGLFAVTGKGKELCPVRALRAWIRARGEDPGPLFWTLRAGRIGYRLRGVHVCSIVKASVASIKLDPSSYGAHSLRAGLVTSCLAAGSSELAVMQRTGHRSVQTLQRYVRPASVFAFDPLSAALQKGA